MTDKLLPCPFCGSPAKRNEESGYIYCPKKYCILEYNENAYIVGMDKWNIRSEQSELAALRQRVKTLEDGLRLYANSKIGKVQPNETQYVVLANGNIVIYDPRPARRALEGKEGAECKS